MSGRRYNGEGSWGAKTINGKKYVRYSKTYNDKRKDFYGLTKKEALEKAKTYEKKLKDIQDDDYQNYSLYDYSKKWLFEWRIKKVKDKTVDYYECILDNLIKDSAIDLLLKTYNSMENHEIDRRIERYIYSLCSSFSKSYIDGLHTVLNLVFSYAVKNHDMGYNPIVNIAKVPDELCKSKKELTALTLEEVKKILNASRARTKNGYLIYGVLAHACLFICFTGIRSGECRALKWEDVDFAKRILTINSQLVNVKNRDKKTDKRNYTYKETTPKSKSGIRYLPLSNIAIDILMFVKNNFESANDYIFSVTGNPFSSSNINRTIKKLCVRAGVKKISPHELRHTYGSILLDTNPDQLQVVSQLLGHSDISVTYKKYIHVYDETKKNANDRLSDKINNFDI